MSNISKKYFKIFNEEDNHHGFQYVDGLNIDSIPFNDNPNKSCVEGGLYFTDAEHICEFLQYGNYIREVTLPDDAKVVKDGNKWRADTLFLNERKDLIKVKTWEWMIDQGINIHADNDLALIYFAYHGHIEVVKFLVQNGADIHADNDYALRWSASNGYIDVVKFLVQNGADIHASDDWALQWSAEHGHIDVVKFLVENGADIHACDDYPLRWSTEYCHIEIIDYLKSSIKQQNLIIKIKNKIISIIYNLYHRIK
jgi:hypothetical protein